MAKQFNVVQYVVNGHGDAFKQEKVVAGPLSKGKANAMRDKLTDDQGDFKPEEPMLSFVVEPVQ